MWIYDKQPLPCNDQRDQGLLVQNIVSLTALRRQLVKYVPTTKNVIKHTYVCWKNVRISCSAKESHILTT